MSLVPSSLIRSTFISLGGAERRYRAFFEGFCRHCGEIVAEDGWVEAVSYKKVLAFIRDLDAERVEGITGRIRERFAQAAKKESFTKCTLAVGKKENADLYGYMKEIY